MFQVEPQNSGQAIIEYLLILLFVVTLIGGMAAGFRGVIVGYWQEMSCDIAAPCPHCDPPDSVKNKIAQTCRSR